MKYKYEVCSFQGDKLMRTASCEPEENFEDLMRMVGSSVDESEKFITAEDYLNPQDMQSDHPLSTRYIRRLTSVSTIYNWTKSLNELEVCSEHYFEFYHLFFWRAFFAKSIKHFKLQFVQRESDIFTGHDVHFWVRIGWELWNSSQQIFPRKTFWLSIKSKLGGNYELELSYLV